MKDLDKRIEEIMTKLDIGHYTYDQTIDEILKLIEENYVPKEKQDTNFEEDQEDEWEECDFCGSKNWGVHQRGCIHSDPLNYNECGYG
jgi:hypothetical protein